MIFLWILLGFLLLVILTCLLPVRLIFDYHCTPRITLKILFFSFDGIDFVKRFLSKDKKEDDKLKNDKQAEKSQKSQQKKSGDLLGFVEFLLHVTDVFTATLGDFFSKARVNLKELHVSLGTDDAAKTAMLSCNVIQAANALCAVLQRYSHFRWNSNNLSISPNFTSDKSKFALNLVISSSLIHIFAVFLRANMRFFD